MDINQLRYYVEIAREMNFGRAARCLGIAQPTLSRSIQSLEKDLGVRLFSRSTRTVKLTPAGNAFLKEAHSILTHVSAAKRIAQRADLEQATSIKIGIAPIGHYHGYQRSVLAFRNQCPSVDIAFEYISNKAQPAALREGRIDAGFFIPYETELRDLEVIVINRSGYVAAIPSGWPQAKAARLRLKDLADCPFVLRSRVSQAPHHYTKKIAACLAAGFHPRIAREVDEADYVRPLVACGVGVTLLPDTETQYMVEGITYVPLTDLPDFLYIDFVMAWLPRSPGEVLQVLINCVKKTASPDRHVAAVRERAARIGEI